jgi:hypothetical protein
MQSGRHSYEPHDLYDRLLKTTLPRISLELATWLFGERPLEIREVNPDLHVVEHRATDAMLHLRFHRRPDVLLHVDEIARLEAIFDQAITCTHLDEIRALL